MAAITWRNVSGPSLAEASRPLEAAQRSIDNAFTGLGGVLRQQESTDAANWNQVKENNTQDFLNKLYSAQGAEGFKALQDSGELERMLAANGAQIDRAAALSAMDGRMGTLQQRDRQGWEFQDAALDQQEAPVVNQVKGFLAQGNLEGAKPLIAGLSARGQANMLTALDQKERQLIERSRGDLEFGWKGAAEAQNQALRPLAVAEAQGKVDNIPLQRDQLRAQINSSNASAAASNESVLTSQANRKRLEEEAKKATERQRLATALEGNLYADGVYTDSNSVDLAKIMKDYSIGGKDEDAGKIRSDITRRLNKLSRDGIKVVGPDGKSETLPIPLGAVKAALLASTDSWGPDNFGSSFERELKARLESVTQKRPSNMLNAPPVMDPMGIMPGSRQPLGAQNKALDDWLAFRNISRSSAEAAPAPKR
jgi:hypothetical protein